MRKTLSLAEEEQAYTMAITGDSLTNIAKALGFAHDYEFYRFRLAHPDFSKLLDGARDASNAHFEDKMLRVTETEASPHAARVKLDAYGRVMGYRNPQRYGTNRIDMSVTTTVDIGSSLARMQARLDDTYRDVTQLAIEAPATKPNDFNDLW